VLYLRIAAVACTVAFVVLLVWLYGVRITVIWAAALAGFLLVLWAATIPLRARQRRVWREMGLGPDGRPLPEIEEDEDAGAPPDSTPGDEAPRRPGRGVRG
jgi:hypothetical protein